MAYSLDLRQKIIDCYTNNEGSIRKLAKRFKVSPDCVRRLIKQYRETGSIAPKAYTGGNTPTLGPKKIEVLKELLGEDNDATLAQLAQRLAEKTEIVVSSSTISRALSKANINRKKKPQTQPSLYTRKPKEKSQLLGNYQEHQSQRFSLS